MALAGGLVAVGNNEYGQEYAEQFYEWVSFNLNIVIGNGNISNHNKLQII